MDSVDKLRELADKLDKAASRISEHGFSPIGLKTKIVCDEIEREIAEHYMLLPVDRSGETWHIGDKFAFAGADGRKHICTVSGVSDCEVFFYYDEHSSSTKHRHFTTRAIAHVKPRTLEDVLCDMIHEYGCTDALTETIADKYAAEIRELLEVRNEL